MDRTAERLSNFPGYKALSEGNDTSVFQKAKIISIKLF